ncbi:thiamine pyrophosphate-binding protein [Amycolatopsis sp. NPDC004368]
MLVHEAIGRFLTEQGVCAAFGVVGSGNFHFTQALVAGGARFVAARHEGGAATMADAYARMSGEVAVLSLHQGCGYTNALPGITEAAKSRTPLLVLTAEANDPASNFFVDQPGLAAGVGAVPLRVRSPRSALSDVAQAFAVCVQQRRTVVLNVPIDVQDQELPPQDDGRLPTAVAPPQPAPGPLAEFAHLLNESARPVFIAGRGGRSPGAAEAIREPGRRRGALLATAAVSRGLFNDDPWSIDVSGGFASPLTAELISQADLVVSFGCALNMWTTRHGALIGPDARLVQIDLDPAAIGRHHDVDLGLWGGVTETARAATELLGSETRVGYRRPEIGERIRTGLRWNQLPFDDESTPDRIDPRTLSATLNRLLPRERTVSVDSGNFLGYPSMYLDVPDENGFCFTQAFQSVGLGLATAVGTALARPDRVPVAALGDGGFLMGLSELDTAVRLELPLLVVVYNDAGYGAEVHHFGAGTAGLENVTFPEHDLAALARGHGCEGRTVRCAEDLGVVTEWLAAKPRKPLVLDAKITSDGGSWWLQEAFGH